MNKKLIIGIGIAVILIVLAALLGKYIGYDIGYEKAVEQKGPEYKTLSLDSWVKADLGNVSIKYPPHEYCGDSEVRFICLLEVGREDFHYAQWSYADKSSDENPFTCGSDFEDCITGTKAESKRVISERRFLVQGKQAVELETETEQFGKLRELIVDLGQEKGIFWLVQYNFTPALNEVYEGIINSIEFK